jgi:hypothetical protein
MLKKKKLPGNLALKTLLKNEGLRLFSTRGAVPGAACFGHPVVDPLV